MEGLSEIHRVQQSKYNDKDNFFNNPNVPGRRVIISGEGKIILNPDSQKFIYFSRSRKHHAYYIFNKIFKIISDELRKAKQDPKFAKLDLPDEFRAFTYYTHVNTEVIKQVKHFFKNYLPPKKVEVVTLQYLNAFSKLFELCATKNNNKTFGKNYPEISDTSLFTGAYGVNDAWLELLKECTVASKTGTIEIPTLLDNILERQHLVKVGNQRLSAVLKCNEPLFEILDSITYRELLNPDFQDKNTPNNITNLLQLIEEHHIYAPTINLDTLFFAERRKEFKDEYHRVIEGM